MAEFGGGAFWITITYCARAYGTVCVLAVALTEDAKRNPKEVLAARTAWRALPRAPIEVPRWIIAQRRAVLREDEDDG